MFEQFLVHIVDAGTILEEKSCRKSEKDKSISHAWVSKLSFSVLSNANFSSIERVRAPVFEYFRARTSPSIRYSNIFEHFH